MRAVRYDSPDAFLDRTRPWLETAELEHSVILSVARLLQSGEHPFHPPIYMASIEQSGEILGCGMRPPPDGLTLTRMPAAAAACLAADMASVYDSLPDVSGPEPAASAFAAEWVRARGGGWWIEFHWRWYAAERVLPPARRPAGFLRLADESDLPWAARWAADYARDVGTRVDVPAFFARRIRTRSLYVWEDDEPRSIVALSGATQSSIRVSAVYTPPHLRGRGYATQAVAEASQTMFDRGFEWCVLLADLANPTANSIYRRIGYEPTFDAVEIRFAGRS